MKMCIFLIFLIIYNNSFAIDDFVDCATVLNPNELSLRVIKAVKNICDDAITNTSLFVLNSSSLPDDFYKKIDEENFYILDDLANNLYLTLNKFSNLIISSAPFTRKALFIFGVDLKKIEDQWLINWFNKSEFGAEHHVKALVETDIESFNYLYDGINNDWRNQINSCNEDKYIYIIIGISVASVLLLITTNLVNYFYIKNIRSKHEKSPLLNANNNEETTNPIQI